ncbi:sodium:proton antiporter [Rhizobium sp. LjRoot98]|uniref:cation:proton antiporter n=1 Tax=Rhizobium sp. LjRoot98 TaxID=3342345 RepID=UPI003ED15E7D
MFDLIALLLTLCALFGWINRKVFKLPHSVGLLIMGLFSSLVLITVEFLFPGEPVYDQVVKTLRAVDFSSVVMDGMLAFLLFAGALTVNFEDLRKRAWPVAYLAFFGTLISTAIVGLSFWYATNILGHPVSLAWALAFGALISPTDPVAVLAVLKTVRVPLAQQVEMQGEALFNDGIGIVLFTLLVSIASARHGAEAVGVLDVAELLAWEAAGGLMLGISTGYISYRAMRAIDDYPVEVLITLALVMATYAIAHKLAMSGPLAMVSAGLIIGHRAKKDAMSTTTEGYVEALWTLIDEVLNSILFLLIGLEVLVLAASLKSLVVAVIAIPAVLVARLVAISAPLFLSPFKTKLAARNVPFLTWAGVRGGISVALALSLPSSSAKGAILAATYSVVLFSIIVQGMTLAWVAQRTLAKPAD